MPSNQTDKAKHLGRLYYHYKQIRENMLRPALMAHTLARGRLHFNKVHGL